MSTSLLPIDSRRLIFLCLGLNYGSPIPIANCKKKAQTKINTFVIRPIQPKIRFLDNTKETTANIIPIIDKMLNKVIPK